MRIRAFDPADTDDVIALWNECGLTRPWNDPRRDIERKLTVQPELFLVGVEPEVDRAAAESIVASAMVGFDGHRGWINYLAVSPAWQRRGYARQLMHKAEALLTARGCPKLNLQVRADNSEALAFYRALGYEPDHAVGLGKRLIPD